MSKFNQRRRHGIYKYCDQGHALIRMKNNNRWPKVRLRVHINMYSTSKTTNKLWLNHNNQVVRQFIMLLLSPEKGAPLIKT